MITYCATFSSPDQADRAAARLRSEGIALRMYRAAMPHAPKTPNLVVGYPYGYPASIASPDYTTGLINGLPQTNGSAVIMPMPLFGHVPARTVSAQYTVMAADAARARRLLVNCGGAGLRMVH